MSYYSMYNYPHMPTMYGSYGGYHNPYMYGGGLYPAHQSYYYGSGGGMGGYGGYYPSYGNSYYGGGYRSPGLFRNMYNRLRYGSSYYYPEMGYMGGGAGAGRWPYERDFSSTKNVWRRNAIYG
ncbi:hypothetical protein BCR42DRAFT_417963 [Absidia repens]|uniref:Uncharacterized protein n=1 Tax=Absidia repens TaxID=90262 RepID=A0A1X2ICV9_9FUNG|nr:hypothetical protein BCR42DRAFT_417963 [Absidia repens]